MQTELYSTTWGMDPSIVIRMLQQGIAMVTSPEEFINANSVNFLSAGGLVRELKNPKKWSTKFVLKLIITRTQQSIVNYEQTKSSLASVLHEFRMAYWHLGRMMTQEGLLPDKELVFFMSPSEWSRLIEGREPALVQRAIQRRQIFSQLDSDTFLDLCLGLPRLTKEILENISYDEQGVGFSIT